MCVCVRAFVLACMYVLLTFAFSCLEREHNTFLPLLTPLESLLVYLQTEVLSPRAQLKQEQAAVSALRDILWLHKDARKDLREVRCPC